MSNVASASGHVHVLAMEVSASDVAAGVQKGYTLTNNGHEHSLTLTAGHFATLSSTGTVTVTSGVTGHAHNVTVTCS